MGENTDQVKRDAIENSVVLSEQRMALWIIENMPKLERSLALAREVSEREPVECVQSMYYCVWCDAGGHHDPDVKIGHKGDCPVTTARALLAAERGA